MRLRSGSVVVTAALVAILAPAALWAALVAPAELRYRRECRQLAARVAYYLDSAANHDDQKAQCAAFVGELPYDRQNREWSPSSLFRVGGFRDWMDEAAWHAQRADLLRHEAGRLALAEKTLRSHLILPVPLDLRRSP